jgi:fructoselysine 6-phosphate deglycase
MDRPFDAKAFLESVAGTANNLDQVAAFGREIAPEVARVYMVASGAGYHIMNALQHLADQVSWDKEFRTFSSADFLSLNPKKLSKKGTLVVLASKSGETIETLDVAKFVKGKADKTIVFTQFGTSSLATHGDKAFFTSQPGEAFLATFMLMQTFVGAILEESEQWGLLDKLLPSLKAFPQAVVSTAQKNMQRAKEDAKRFNSENQFYFIASGPGDAAANLFGRCILEEMFRYSIHADKPSHFFHSTLEVVDKTTQLILIITEDSNRDQMERAEKFCSTYGDRVVIYNSRDCSKEGIAPEIWPLVATYVVCYQLVLMVPYIQLDRPLAQRKYMGVVEY